MTDHLLPPNATEAERAISVSSGGRVEAVPIPQRLLWDPQNIPAELLPYLAWTVSTDDWQPQWPEEIKRQVVADSIQIHRRKGTPWAVKRGLVNLGYRDVEILEATNFRYNGTYEYDGTITYGGDIGPYEFDVLLNVATAIEPLSDIVIDGGDPWGTGVGAYDGGSAADPGEGVLLGGSAAATEIAMGEVTEEMLAEVARVIDVYKNERSKLRQIWHYELYYDGTVIYDGTYRYDGGIVYGVAA